MQIRESIKSLFPDRDCFTLVSPHCSVLQWPQCTGDSAALCAPSAQQPWVLQMPAELHWPALRSTVGRRCAPSTMRTSWPAWTRCPQGRCAPSSSEGAVQVASSSCSAPCMHSCMTGVAHHKSMLAGHWGVCLAPLVAVSSPLPSPALPPRLQGRPAPPHPAHLLQGAAQAAGLPDPERPHAGGPDRGLRQCHQQRVRAGRQLLER